MSVPIIKAIYETLCYADVFDYALKENEIYERLIGIKASTADIKKNLRKLDGLVERSGYYTLQGSALNIKKRLARITFSQKKFHLATRYAKFISIIPTVLLVGISGALSSGNTRRGDDIDIFIITRKKLLWLTRFFVNIFTEMIGIRRHPHDTTIADKICLNMFVDEDNLDLPKNEHDLFSAYEIIQLIPVINKGEIYEKFLKQNIWIRKYLPNAKKRIFLKVLRQQTQIPSKISYLKSLTRNLALPLYVCEIIFYKLQLLYMKGRITNEVISPSVARFHPADARKWILQEFARRKKVFLPLSY